jgi:hypothetical protein
MMRKSSVLWRKQTSSSKPGPDPKANRGEAVWIWLAQPVRRYGLRTKARQQIQV